MIYGLTIVIGLVFTDDAEAVHRVSANIFIDTVL